MMVLIPAAALLPFAARLRRRWDEDRYREEMLFEEELRRRQQQEKKQPMSTYRQPRTPQEKVLLGFLATIALEVLAGLFFLL